MKKILAIAAAIAIAPPAYGAQNCCANVCPIPIGGSVNYDSSCTNSSICNCAGTTQTTLSGGVIRITTTKRTTQCVNNVATASCSSNNTYKCAQGYYGSPTEFNKTCTRCPTSGGIAGTTSGSGATSITECYIESGSTGSDSTGSFTYTGNCYYSN